MSSDDDVLSRSKRALRSKSTAPVTPIESETESDDEEGKENKVDRSYARPRIHWNRIITINKGECDDDERKERIAAGARVFMDRGGPECEEKRPKFGREVVTSFTTS